jgi:serine/threonine-protein kinase
MSAERSLVQKEPEPEPAPGDLIAGKYRVERVIGRGGMGIVIAATHERLRELVAIKLIRSGSGMGTKDAIARFLREARAIVKIKSPYVARIFDVDTLADGMPYMVMEYLEGRNLYQELSERGALPLEEAVDYAIQACLALAAAHEVGVVHRDLKPSNLFLAQGSRGSKQIKVLDFGISKILAGSSVDAAEDTLTAPNSVMGSPSYMSPEQFRDSKEVDQRADIWSVGVISYELLAGRRPFSGQTTSATLASICGDSPAPLLSARPEVPAELARLIESCLEKPRDRRPQSVSVVQETLLPFASARMQSICAHGVDLPLSRPSEPARAERRGLSQGAPLSADQMPTRNERGPASSNASAPPSWIESAPTAISGGPTLRTLEQRGLSDETKVNAPLARPSQDVPAAPPQRQHAALMFMAGVIATLTVLVAALLTKLERSPPPAAQARVWSAQEMRPRAMETPYSVNAPASDDDASIAMDPGASEDFASRVKTTAAPILSSSAPVPGPTHGEASKPSVQASSTSKVRKKGAGGARIPKSPVVPRPKEAVGPPLLDEIEGH